MHILVIEEVGSHGTEALLMMPVPRWFDWGEVSKALAYLGVNNWREVSRMDVENPVLADQLYSPFVM